MKQGLEVLWWKHNMIPTKESIQQTSEPPSKKHPLTPGQPPTSDIHTFTLILPPCQLFPPIWLKPQWTSEGSRLVDEGQKATAKCLQAASLHFSTGASFRRICQRKRNQGDPWSPEECQSPAMHGEYPLLAHTFIQTRVGTPQGPPLSGASSVFISADGAPKC